MRPFHPHPFARWAVAPRRAAWITLLLFLLPSLGSFGEDTNSVQQTIRDLLGQQVQAWNDGNVEKFMETYERGPELRFASEGTVVHGWQSTLDRYKARYSDRAKMGRLTLSELDISVLSTNAAMVFGRWRLDREQDTPNGLFTLLFRKGSSGWRIVHDHTSAAGTTLAGAAQPSDASKGNPSNPAGEDWKSLFDGKSLNGWKVTDFGGHGDVEVKEGRIILGQGALLTGINLTRTNELPKTNYEVSFDAMKIEGGDFFGALTLPVGDSACSFIVGGWGGSVVGISSIDGQDASENETTKYMKFEKGRWYRVRVRVTASSIEAWIDNEKMAEVITTDRKISMRAGEIEQSQPLGIAAYQTTGALREIKMRRTR